MSLLETSPKSSVPLALLDANAAKLKRTHESFLQRRKSASYASSASAAYWMRSQYVPFAREATHAGEFALTRTDLIDIVKKSEEFDLEPSELHAIVNALTTAFAVQGLGGKWASLPPFYVENDRFPPTLNEGHEGSFFRERTKLLREQVDGNGSINNDEAAILEKIEFPVRILHWRANGRYPKYYHPWSS